MSTNRLRLYHRKLAPLPRTHTANYIHDFAYACLPQDAGSDAGTIPASADEMDFPVARKASCVLRDVAGHDVFGSFDVAGIPFSIAGNIKHERAVRAAV